MSHWNYKPVEKEDVRPYIIKRDYGDIILHGAAYTDKEGRIFIDKFAVEVLPPDVTKEDMDGSWIRGFPPGTED
jgi:hypothetical protein